MIFHASVDGEISFPTSMVVLEDQVCLGMVLQILLRQINLGLFLMVVARRFVLAISIPATTSSAMVIRSLGSNDVDKVVPLFVPGILVVVLLPMLLD